MNKLENEKISGLKLSSYIIGGIVIISFVITMISLNIKSKDENNSNNSNLQQNESVENTNPSKFDRTIIKLSEETETSNIDDNLKIEFTRDPMQEAIYSANIILNGNNINSSLFDGNVWAEDYTGIFNVYDVDNYYVLVSSVAKQCDGDYVLIIDKNGNTIKTYTDVDFSIEKTVISIVDYDVCTTDNSSSKNEEFDLKDLK